MEKSSPRNSLREEKSIKGVINMDESGRSEDDSITQILLQENNPIDLGKKSENEILPIEKLAHKTSVVPTVTSAKLEKDSQDLRDAYKNKN